MEDQKTTKTNSKRKLKRGKLFQFVFISLSIIFIIGCVIFYGVRLIKYYKIYNPKTESGEAIELVAASIVKNSSIVYENDGLYHLSGQYIYKGKEVNNYLRISNMVFRILKINNDGSIDLILDKPINYLMWNDKHTTYLKSDINTYLNEVFIPKINKDNLTVTTTCLDEINDITKITCNTKDTTNYVRLLSINEYLNSENEEKNTFINNTPNIWLTDSSKDKVWSTNENSLSTVDANSLYAIKPVITLKNSLVLINGKGTEEEPFIIDKEKKELTYGSIIKLDNDLWTVYDIIDDKLKLTNTTLIEDGNDMHRFSNKTSVFDLDDETSLAYYLNNNYLDTLSYKNLIIEDKWYIGEYANSYVDVLKETIKSKVGLLNVIDLKYNNDLDYYYLSTRASDTEVYLSGKDVLISKVYLPHPIRACITIKSSLIKEGSGTIDEPYILEESK